MDRDLKKTLLMLAAVGVAGYVGYRLLRGAAGAIGKGLTSAGEALGSGIYDFFHKDQVGETLYYLVTFQGGMKHSIPSRSVDPQGYFDYKGARYRLLVDRRIVSGANKFAFPA